MDIPEDIQLRMILGKPGVRELKAPYSVFWRGDVWTVSSGYMTDGSSIPRLLWFWLGGKFDYANAQAGVVHDAAYDGRLFRNGVPAWMSPMQAHAFWREARTFLFQAGAGRFMRARYWLQGWLCWAALVVFYVVWGRKRYVSVKTWRERHPQHE